MKPVRNPKLGPTTFPRRHLFLDTDNLLEWDIRTWQNFPKPSLLPTEGIECGPPGSWDARIAAGWGSVLYDEGRFRGWVCCMPGILSLRENCDIWLSGYVESEDGIHWRKPDLRITAQKRWPGNNLLKLPGCVMSVVRPLPSAGCKFLALTIQVEPPYPGVTDDSSIEFNGPGDYLFASDDGLRWRQITRNPMIQHGDWACLHVDSVRKRYRLYQKVAASHGLTSRRAMLVLESDDAIHWEGYHGTRQWHETFLTDDYDDCLAQQRGYRIAEYYSHCIHQVDTLYLAIQTLFTVGLPLHQRIRQNPNGVSHLRLAYSHDGLIWRHPRGRPPFLDGLSPGEFGAGFLTTNNNLVEHNDQMWLFCSAGDRDHGWGILPDFRLDPAIAPRDQERRVRILAARWPRDRFGSIALNQRGTVDVEIGPRQGRSFTLNAITRGDGAIRVAFAKQRSPYHMEPRVGESLPGFSFEDCDPIRGDHVRAPVRFRRRKIADLPRDQFLVLRLEIAGGEVFGYEWND